MELPKEIWIHISSFLNKSELNFYLVCKEFFHFTNYYDSFPNIIEYVVSVGNIGVLKYINQLKVDKNNLTNKTFFKNFDTQKCLMTSCKYNQLYMMHYLVLQGANIHSDNNKILHYACQKGYLDMVQFLVKNKVNIHARNDYAVQLSSGMGHLKLVKYLVSIGANIHANNDFAFQWACGDGRIKVVKYLVSIGANIGVRNNYPIYWALLNGHQEVVNYLISLGINYDTIELTKSENDNVLDSTNSNAFSNHFKLKKKFVKNKCSN
ncbi:ankyrin repeat protein [Megavirus baoshan]|uniref:Ankyrin repeat protein n=1 Tax=Megavirus baoshan TaxID=2496520 RepID=A0A3Q8U8J7_9VIRU|nr:ankyrin repeat protein [Megavirus baoshan]AZL89801.1 ankyrin repeat protein [Megavirus baoshan]